jgi:hypothetical protein
MQTGHPGNIRALRNATGALHLCSGRGPQSLVAVPLLQHALNFKPTIEICSEKRSLSKYFCLLTAHLVLELGGRQVHNETGAAFCRNLHPYAAGVRTSPPPCQQCSSCDTE